MQDRYRRVRGLTDMLVGPLSAEDCQAQSMPDASPVKWHMAHSSWFFETFILRKRPEYRPFNPAYATLFNSYYEGVGPQFARHQRGLLTRPSIDEIIAYRRHIDQAMTSLMNQRPLVEWHMLVELGCQHEQQHQELILTDVKHLLAVSLLEGAYAVSEGPAPATRPAAWRAHKGGLIDIGHQGAGFSFDQEGPRHAAWLDPFAIGSRLVTTGEYLLFMEDGGYQQPALWLADGWDHAQREGWTAPLYWRQEAGQWTRFTLGGREAIRRDEPVTHVSFYEADAYARWAGHRLPSETEWESAASLKDMEQLYDSAWQWTASAYLPYPGYRPAEGAIGEYNGKFMSNRMVLRGGSAFTPTGHSRRSYRNFFPPETRWQLSGIRLAAAK